MKKSWTGLPTAFWSTQNFHVGFAWCFFLPKLLQATSGKTNIHLMVAKRSWRREEALNEITNTCQQYSNLKRSSMLVLLRLFLGCKFVCWKSDFKMVNLRTDSKTNSIPREMKKKPEQNYQYVSTIFWPTKIFHVGLAWPFSLPKLLQAPSAKQNIYLMVSKRSWWREEAQNKITNTWQ